MQEADVTIVGGGLVGASLAAAIASHPNARTLRILLLDPNPPSSHFQQTSLRTSTITPSSKHFLDHTGIWTRIPPSRISSFNHMHIWDLPNSLPTSPSSPGTLSFTHTSPLAYVIDNDTLRTATYMRLRQLAPSAQIVTLADTLASIHFGVPPRASPGGETHVPWPVLKLQSGGHVRTRLLVAADGSRSRVRALAEGDWICGAYGQYAVVANVCLDEEVTAGYQRFVSTGPVALLPVATEDTLAPMGNVIWSTTQAEARGLVECSDGQFVDEVNAALCGSDDDGDAYEVPGVLKKGLHMWRGKRGDVVALPPRAVGVKGKRGWFPLMQGHAGRYVYAEKRSVVVGDAGHAVHPMAGQGVNMGYADVEALAGCIVGGASVGRDVGGEGGAVLAAYERERMIRNMGVLGVLGGLHTVFGSQRIAEWRRFGMGILDASPVVKKLLMRAMR